MNKHLSSTKRILIIIISVILTISVYPISALAVGRDVSIEESMATELKALGLFRGVSETDFDLLREPSRIEALVMLIRLLGKEQEAINGAWKHPFTDVPEWADKYVGYAYSNNITNGISEDKFGMGIADASVYLTFVLRALGYSDKNEQDFSWRNPFTLAKDTGILLEQVDTMSFLRADVVTISYSALRARIKDSSFTLAEKLIKSGVFTLEQFTQNYDHWHENSLIDKASEIDILMSEAIAQYYAEDYTSLAEPVAYNILWLGYTHVTYGELDFRMTAFDRDYLRAVALNFEKSVERITSHNLDISIDLYFVDDETTLTKTTNDDWLYLSIETTQKEIDKHLLEKQYDTVFTTVQTAGAENASRNSSKVGYGKNYVMLGLKFRGLEDSIGYSTFDLSEPKPGTYPLADPEIPSLYATAVAVHEWMHQLEYLGTLLGIEYPNTHAYIGPAEYPGYSAYIADKNNYDYFEFYELVLQGKLPYTSNGKVKHVGIYPKMWKLVKRNILELGVYSILAENGKGYLTANADNLQLTISNQEFLWSVRYSGNGRYVFKPKNNPDLQIDLSNAWDTENNKVGVFYNTGYVDAQSWLLSKNDDGTYYIRTPYESGRVITVTGKGESAVIKTINQSSGSRKWIFSFIIN